MLPARRSACGSLRYPVRFCCCLSIAVAGTTMAIRQSLGTLPQVQAVRRRGEQAQAADPPVASHREQRESHLVEVQGPALEGTRTKAARRVVARPGKLLRAPRRAARWAVPERRVVLECRAALAADRARVVRISIVARAAVERPTATQALTAVGRCRQRATERPLAAASAGKGRALSARKAASFNAAVVDTSEAALN